ncbi:cysteine proteinase inhibitor B-like [Phalaenopsis equestris]|uniref:cysteine proteinase inhibitor B-like n=1 Tax=Phalaenopsis equestris TaxID=78828 RepID=UPI0009E2DAA7|nr:cysteine proteinase inhibitor B-like [Phalaenopsis equestris]
MAASSLSLLNSIPSISLLSIILSAFLFSTSSAYQLGGVRGWGKRIGAWTDIPDAASNLEVRELGRYSVDEYNRRLRGPGNAPIAFSDVLSARRQVFSGIKYHLRVSAVGFHDSHHLTFDAVVVARTWIPEPSHDLLSFTPSDA